MTMKNSIAIVTGGTSGIGLCMVKTLLNYGAKYIAHFELDNEKTRCSYSAIEKEYGCRVGFYPTDVTDTKQFGNNMDAVLKTHKSIDILLNNAGVITENAPSRLIDINYKAVVMGTLMYIDRVGKHKCGNGGVVVNTASILGLMNLEFPVYCSTKHAVVSFTRTMAGQVCNTGVRVTAICPGLTKTPLLEQFVETLDYMTEKGKVAALPMQSPQNVADGVATLIECGESGEIWVAEEDKPAYPVRPFYDYKSLRMKK